MCNKKIQVNYECIWVLSSSEIQILCGKMRGTIDCGERHINMVSAVWGRTDDSTCGSDATTDCTLDAISYMIPRCDHRRSCTFKPRTGIFGGVNPCSRVDKYLNITYTCEGSILNFQEE